MRYDFPPKLDPTTRAAAPAESVPPPNSLPPAAEQHIADDELRRLTKLYEDLNRMDHYRLLGVSATDDAKAIKRAYFALAKGHHPDRWFRKDIGALRNKIEAIFNAMTTAEATLTNAEKRAEYDAYLRELLKTRLARRQAHALEADKNWLSAAETWARIVEQLPTDAYVQHRYAYALLRSGTGYERAMAAATRAIELDSTRAEYRITAASLHLAEGRDRSALAQLAVACEIEPDRADIAGLYAALGERLARTR